MHKMIACNILRHSRNSLCRLDEGSDVMRFRFHEFAKQPKKSSCLQVVRSESQRTAINRKDAKCNFNIVNLNDQKDHKMSQIKHELTQAKHLVRQQQMHDDISGTVSEGQRLALANKFIALEESMNQWLMDGHLSQSDQDKLHNALDVMWAVQ
tara:strand:+ start:6399 stop:6857 length:459 start_codon:yes stop_codon:yes gene_type:complete